MEDSTIKHPYEPFDWKDHVVQKQRTYRMSENNDGTITLTPEEGEVYQQGTPINANRLNHMEQGVYNVSEKAAATEEALKLAQDEIEEKLKEKEGSYIVFLNCPASGWEQSETGRYTQVVTVENFDANTRCRSIEIDLSNAEEGTIADVRDAWALIDKAETVEGGVMLTAFDDMPKVDFSVIIEVVK